MTRALRLPGRSPASPFGLLLALVALAVQLAAVGVVPFAGAPAAGVDRLLAVSICHGDSGTPAGHHAPACTVCPICQAIAHAGVLLASPAFGFVAPAMVAMRAFALPPARAPPGRPTTAASARGPPLPL
jgi:hypothetical protein